MGEKYRLESELRDVSYKMQGVRARLVDFQYAAKETSNATGLWKDSSVQSSFILQASIPH